MAKIWIKNQQKQIVIDPHRIRRIVKGILEELGLPDPEISILLLDDPQITQLNQKYLNRNQPTDVISFPMDNGFFQEGQPQLLGDVVISVDTASRQACEQHHTLYEEMIILLAHGILHLLGYDHEKSAHDAKRMQIKENELFDKIRRDEKKETKAI